MGLGIVKPQRTLGPVPEGWVCSESQDGLVRVGAHSRGQGQGRLTLSL